MRTPSILDHRTAAVRRFNRFYTREIGTLQQGLLESKFSLAEVRVLYEIANRQDPTATEIGRDLRLDAGYVSRLVLKLDKAGLIERVASESDGRQTHLRLTTRGRTQYTDLDFLANGQVTTMLYRLNEQKQRLLVESMRNIESLLAPVQEQKEPYLLRPHQPGDMGWVVHRHGVLYAREYGWDERFEALVARIAADFIDNLDARRERCWIAEREGEIVGSVFLVREPENFEVAKLRLLLVEPSARGLGLGHRLVDECTRFARQVGYKKITLWTNHVLLAARHIYAKAGYQMVGQESHSSFGHSMISETWELAL
ncbi:helix-turn-helix domain-containing GNAT family N-acetyltransferase [uncultured Paludibaculum sp.]|uniref:bifunctional helix-turn-helix transcriptional regulator/GNAT family N-acetyltransferase n=1 Tax=uncultured Paludibaculum sp. TaxID=1765020 RepID=UPI002AABB834|nr:helix-turn-helix domain-containing GNAT family N-acetyltransferase [uncultured Paludibaculum sp.]